MYKHLYNGYLVREEFVKAKLNMNHVFVLSWFTNFIKSGKMDSYLNTNDGIIYYWISFDKIRKDIPELNTASRWKIKRIFDELSGKGKTGNFPMKKGITINKQRGRKSCFALDPVGYPLFCINSVKQEKEVKMNYNKKYSYPTKSKDNYDLTPIGRKIIEEILDVKECIFHHKLNEPGTPATALLLQIEIYLEQLYSGTFGKNKFEKTWFDKKDADTVKKELKKLEGNWKVIEETIKDLVYNYSQWCIEKGNDDKQIKNLATWFYNPRTGKSFFLTWLCGEMKFIDDFAFDNIKKGFDHRTGELISDFYDPVMDKKVFVYKIREVYDYLVKFYHDIVYLNRDEPEWKCKVPTIMKNLFEFADKKEIKNANAFGLEGYAWTKFVDYYKSYSNIELCPGIEILMEMRKRRIKEHDRMKERVLEGAK